MATKYSYKLPSGKKLALCEPTVADVRKIANLGPKVNEADRDAVVLSTLGCELDGKVLSYEDLKGNALDSLVTAKDYAAIQRIIAKLIAPDEEEMAAVMGSVQVVAS